MGETTEADASATEYTIGGGQYDDLGVFWSRQISHSDQVSILSISEEVLSREFHLHSVEFSNFSDSTFDTIAKICKFFTHALEARKGTFGMNEIETEFPNDVAFAWILIGLLEKRLVEYRQIGSVWVQIFWALIFLMWTRTTSWMTWIVVSVCLLIMLFSSIHILVPIRKWVYFNGLSFFDTQLIPTSISPLLLFGPGTLIALNRMENWTCSLWPLGLAVPAIVCALMTNIVTGPSSIRAVYKLSIASILLFNIVFILFVTFGISFWYGLCMGLIFNWNIFSALLGMVVLGIVLASAFLRDVVSACRRNDRLRIVFLTVLPILLGWACMKWNQMGWIKCMFIGIGIGGSAFIGIPQPSQRMKSILSRIAVFAIDVFQLIVVTIQTVTATCIIFSNSPKLGIEWVKYLAYTFSMRPANGSEPSS